MNPPPHLVLSVSQIQTSGGLLILNNQQQQQQHGHPHPHHLGEQQYHPNGLTPLHHGGHGHSIGQPDPHASRNSDSMESNASSSPSGAATVSPVSSAVRSLTSLSDFSLDVNNANYGGHHGPNGEYPVMQDGKGPLLDFKTAFTPMDGKPEMG